MNFYDMVMNPLEELLLRKIRGKCIPAARGKVLEIGIGTGANIPFYRFGKITCLTGLDLKLTGEIKEFSNKVNLVEANVESLPFDDNSFDSVVATLVLCSVSEPEKAVAEIKRVLKPNGRYVFVEHILPEKSGLAPFFNKINSLWKRIAHGCNINRSTDKTIQSAGFHVKAFGGKANGIFCYGVAENTQ